MGLHNKFLGADFNITRGKVRVACALLAQDHLTRYRNNAFHADMLGRFHNVRPGGNNNLGHARFVPQVNKQQATMVALAVHPAGQARGCASIARA